MTDFALTPPRAPRRKAVRAEQALHIAVADYLRLALPHGYFFLHVANEGIRSKAAAGILKRMGLLSGAADIFIVGSGKLWCLELKSAAGRQSDEQVAFQARCEAAGVPYSVCRSVADAAEQLAAWRISARARVAA